MRLYLAQQELPVTEWRVSSVSGTLPNRLPCHSMAASSDDDTSFVEGLQQQFSSASLLGTDDEGDVVVTVKGAWQGAIGPQLPRSHPLHRPRQTRTRRATRRPRWKRHTPLWEVH